MQRTWTDLFLCCPLIQPEFRLYLLTNIHEVASQMDGWNRANWFKFYEPKILV